MDNNFKDYVKEDDQFASELYFLDNAVRDAEFYVSYAKTRITMPVESIPKPLRRIMKKLGIDLK